MIRVVIADDQALVREGVSVLLSAQPDIEVVGEAADGRGAVELAATLHPDVVLMDVRMPGMNGLEATRQVLAEGRAEGGDRSDRERPDHQPADAETPLPGGEPSSGTRVLVLTTFDLDEYVYEALRAGASGFLLKDASARTLAEAVRIVAAGDALLSPSITRRLIAQFARLGGPAPPTRARIEHLTERETEVLVLVARGLSNAEIAQALVVAEQTVKTHVSRILVKLALRDRTQAAVFAYETGLIRPQD